MNRLVSPEQFGFVVAADNAQRRGEAIPQWFKAFAASYGVTFKEKRAMSKRKGGKKKC